MVSKKTVIFISIALVLLTASVSIFGTGLFLDYVGGGSASLTAEEYKTWQEYKKIDEIVKAINDKYLLEYDDQDLVNGALKGLVAGLGDPYSTYYTPEEYQSMMSDMQGTYAGIGVMITTDPTDKMITVSRVFDNSPAQKAGLQKGDKFNKVGGESTVGWTQEQLSAAVRGEAGTTVQVEILRGENKEPMVFDVARENLVAQRIASRMLADNIGYIEVMEFNANVTEDFNKAIDKLKEDGAVGIVIDLRDNPGGYLDDVVKMCDKLLPEGKIVYTQDKLGRQQTYNSDAAFVDIPLTILINGGSASASEIMAGAFKDYKRATLVGEKTFGKGIVQQTERFKDGSGLKLTISRYYTPNGVNIHDEGIAPDIEVALPEELVKNPLLLTDENDTQLHKAIEVLKAG